MVPGETAREEWVALGAASRLLGVDPDTLRRWADRGRIEVFTTPGGHRRFLRSALETLASPQAGSRPPLARLGATSDRLSAAYRRSYAAGSLRTQSRGPRPGPGAPIRPVAENHGAMDPRDIEAFRHDGRLLLGALLRYLDAADELERARAEGEASLVAGQFGARIAMRGLGLGEGLTRFVSARRPILDELSTLAYRRSLDVRELAALYETASTLLDRLLLRFVEAHAAAVGAEQAG